MSARFPKEFLDCAFALVGAATARRGVQAPGERAGELGRGLEFAEHRAYQPGDDPAQLDWAVYARTNKPFLKVQHQLQLRRVSLLIDLSRSMEYGAPPKVDRALRGAVTIALAEVLGGSQAQLIGMGASAAPAGAVLQRIAQLRSCVEQLDTWTAVGEERTLERDRLRYLDVLETQRPRSVWIFSDFYALHAWAQYCEKLMARGVHPKLVWVLDPEELDPTLQQAVEWIDAETKERRRIDDPERAKRAYAEQLERQRERFRALTSRHRLAALLLGEPEHDLLQLVRFQRGLHAQ